MSNSPYDYQPPFFDEEDYPDIDKRTCRLLGPTALIVQGLMGVVVISSLVYKRHREKPKRPWKIWSFDVSKQIVGQMFVHGVNVLISDLVAHHASGNPCVLYFLNILIDTTLGVAIIYIIHHSLIYILSDKLHFKGFQSGKYGNPPSFTYWARQAAVYVTSLTTMKLLIVVLFTVWPGIEKIGQWLLSWTGGSDAAQVIFVMGIFPIVMNILQFWLIDSIVKASASQSNPILPEVAPTDSADHEPLMEGSESDDEELGGSSSHHDTENPPPTEDRVSDATMSRNMSNDERKLPSSKTSSITEWEDEDAHPYPPSLSPHRNVESSPKRTSASLNLRFQSANIKLKRIGRKRSIPPPLRLSPQPRAIDRSGTQMIVMGATPRSNCKSAPALPDVREPYENPTSQTGANNWDVTTNHSEGLSLYQA